MYSICVWLSLTVEKLVRVTPGKCHSYRQTLKALNHTRVETESILAGRDVSDLCLCLTQVRNSFPKHTLATGKTSVITNRDTHTQTNMLYILRSTFLVENEYICTCYAYKNKLEFMQMCVLSLKWKLQRRKQQLATTLKPQTGEENKIWSWYSCKCCFDICSPTM